MKKSWLAILVLPLIIGGSTVLAGGKDGNSMQFNQFKNETRILISDLPRGVKGDREAIHRLVGLASGRYIDTAEGGEWIAETYLDLLVKQPYAFLSVLAQQEPAVQRRVQEKLLSPVSEKYPREQLLGAVQSVRDKKLDEGFLDRLASTYSAMPR